MCKRILTSRLGLFLVVAHLIIIIFEFRQKASFPYMPCEGDRFQGAGVLFVAGRFFHWNYESVLLQIVTLLDFPAIAFSSLFSDLFSSLNLCAYPKSWVEAIAVLIFASLQWLLIGFGLQELVRSLKKSNE